MRRDAAGKPFSPYTLGEIALSAVKEPYGLPGDPARKSLKELMELLTDRQYPNGKMRDCPKAAFEATATGWKAAIFDAELSVRYQVDFEHLEELLLALCDCVRGLRGSVVTVRYGKGWERMKAEEAKILGKR